MKKGTPRHPKTVSLARHLAVERAAAVGYLEMLWHFTAEFAPRGDVGRFGNVEIAEAVYWPGDPDQLVQALIDARWLDEDDEHRLLVHDWHEHADDYTKKRLQRAGVNFVTYPSELPRIIPSVYFVRSGSGLIKIGFTEGAIDLRVKALQTGSPEKLELLASCPGTKTYERELHRRFASHSVSGEWFRPSEHLTTLIAELKKRCPAEVGERQENDGSRSPDNGRQNSPHARAVPVPCLANAMPAPAPVPSGAWPLTAAAVRYHFPATDDALIAEIAAAAAAVDPAFRDAEIARCVKTAAETKRDQRSAALFKRTVPQVAQSWLDRFQALKPQCQLCNRSAVFGQELCDECATTIEASARDPATGLDQPGGVP